MFRKNIKIKIFYPDWNLYGKKAGPLIVLECTHMIAFPSKNSIGTFDSINKAKKQEKELIIIEV